MKRTKNQRRIKTIRPKKYRYEIIKLDNENQERNIVVIKNE